MTRRSATLRLLAVAAFLLATTGWRADPATARPLDEVRESGTIRIAVYRDFAPFSEVSDGRFAGVDVDIARAIAERLGLPVSLMPLTAGETVDDDLRNAVWKGHYLGGGVADVMLHVPVDRRFALRNKQVAIFGPYARMRLVMAGSRDPDTGVTSLAELGERSEGRVGVEIATLADYYLLNAFGGSLRGRLVHYPTTIAAADALRAGEVVAAFGTEAEIEAGLGPARKDFEISPVEIPGSTWLIGAAVDERSRDLGYAVGDIIAEMVESGKMTRTFLDHGLSYAPPDAE
ncbi:MAG: transporter substrate-binding domain-containing protein [Rhodospirillales bacterium]|nr:transporter substrate-binding domain-containing protein [Rhodospirillales bacterium]